MMIIIPCCATVVLLAIAPLARTNETDAGPLDGAWRLIARGVDKIGPVSPGIAAVTIKANQAHYGGALLARLQIDAAAMPAAIDLTFADPEQTHAGVFRVEGDKLTICLNARADVKERPLDFGLREDGKRRLLVFQRLGSVSPADLKGLHGLVGIAISGHNNVFTISQTTPGGPAAQAGLRKGDVLVKVGDAAVTNLPSTLLIMLRAVPDSKLVFRIRRDGAESDVTVTVGVMPFRPLAMLR
jgi:uncharacterized protein (TIGR03067 family)